MFGAVLGGAFLGGLADNMRENREYVRQKSDAMQEYLWKAGLDRQQEVKKVRNALTAASDYLEEKGLTRDNLLTILDEDPKKILTLERAAKEAEENGILTPVLINSAVEAGSGYSDPDMDPAELIKKATPEFVESSVLKKPEKKEQTILQKLFSPTTSDEIMYDVYSSEIMGRKGADIQASISAPLVKERTGTVKTDIGVFADDDQYDSTQKNNMKRQIESSYDSKLSSQKTLLTNKLNDTSITQTEKDTIEARILELGELDDMIKEGSSNLEYQKLMLMYPSIVQSLYNTNPLAKIILDDPGYFGFNTTQMETLFGGFN
jgi:hypothetical protein